MIIILKVQDGSHGLLYWPVNKEAKTLASLAGKDAFGHGDLALIGRLFEIEVQK